MAFRSSFSVRTLSKSIQSVFCLFKTSLSQEKSVPGHSGSLSACCTVSMIIKPVHPKFMFRTLQKMLNLACLLCPAPFYQSLSNAILRQNSAYLWWNTFSLPWPYFLTINSPFSNSLPFVQTRIALIYLYFFIRSWVLLNIYGVSL